MVFDRELTIAQVAIIPLITTTIGALKRLLPLIPILGDYFENLHNDAWFGASLFLGVAYQITAYFAFVGTPKGLAEWFTLSVIGLAFGLAAGKAYDEAKARTGSND